MDDIQYHCARLLSSDFAVHSAAYLWLRNCRPFRRLVDRFREREMNLFDVAAMLAPGSTRKLSEVAVRMLADEIARERMYAN